MASKWKKKCVDLQAELDAARVEVEQLRAAVKAFEVMIRPTVPTVTPLPYVSSPTGYMCACGLWVNYGTVHTCYTWPPMYPYVTWTSTGGGNVQQATGGYTTTANVTLNGGLSIVRDDEDPPDMGVPAVA